MNKTKKIIIISTCVLAVFALFLWGVRIKQRFIRFCVVDFQDGKQSALALNELKSIIEEKGFILKPSKKPALKYEYVKNGNTFSITTYWRAYKKNRTVITLFSSVDTFWYNLPRLKKLLRETFSSVVSPVLKKYPPTKSYKQYGDNERTYQILWMFKIKEKERPQIDPGGRDKL